MSEGSQRHQCEDHDNGRFQGSTGREFCSPDAAEAAAEAALAAAAAADAAYPAQTASCQVLPHIPGDALYISSNAVVPQHTPRDLILKVKCSHGWLLLALPLCSMLNYGRQQLNLAFRHT